MADPVSTLGGAGTVIGLADVGCRLTSKLYKFFSSVHEASRSIQRLSRELQQLHGVLQEVQRYVNRYKDSPFVNQDGLSSSQLHILLQECQAELADLESLANAFQNHPSKVKDLARRIKWAVDEKKIEQHHKALERLQNRITTMLSAAGRQHDIDLRHLTESLGTQIADVHEVLNSHIAHTNELMTFDHAATQKATENVSSNVPQTHRGLEIGVAKDVIQIKDGQELIRSDLESQKAQIQAGFDQSTLDMCRVKDIIQGEILGGTEVLQTAHIKLNQQILQNRKRGFKSSRTIGEKVNDIKIELQKNQQEAKYELQSMNISLQRMESMLSQSSLERSKDTDSSLESGAIFDTNINNIMLPLLFMGSSVHEMTSPILTGGATDISKEEVLFLLDEYEALVAFGHEAAARKAYGESGRAHLETRRPRPSSRQALMFHDYASTFGDGNLSAPFNSKFATSKTTVNLVGSLRIAFRRKCEEGRRLANDMDVRLIFIPRKGIPCSGVSVCFQKSVQADSRPRFSRSLQEIRFSNVALTQLRQILRSDDLPNLQLLLLTGKLNPLDEIRDCIHGNLISMAALHFNGQRTPRILNYLLQDARDLAKSPSLLSNLWTNYMEYNWRSKEESPQDLQTYIDVTVRMIGLGISVHSYDPTFGYNALHQMSESCYRYYSILDKACKFLLWIGVDMELSAYNGQTPLLRAAHSSWEASTEWLEVLLANGAKFSAVDRRERGALHLALQKDPLYRNFYGEASWALFTKAKLVLLLRAGCSPGQKDRAGRTPAQYAGQMCLHRVWHEALFEAGMSSIE